MAGISDDIGRNFGLTEELKIETTPAFFTTTGDPHSGGKQDDPAANDPAERARIIEKLKGDLKRGTDPKTGEPYTKQQIQKKRRRLKLLEGRHHRIKGQKGTKAGKPAPKPGQPGKPKPGQPAHPKPEPQHVKPGQPKPIPKPKPPAPPHSHPPRPEGQQQHPHSRGDGAHGQHGVGQTDELGADIANENLGVVELIEQSEGATFELAGQENDDLREDEAEYVRQDAADEEDAEDAENDGEGDDDGDELADCVWTPDRERSRSAKSFIGKLATDSLDLVGGSGSGTASAYGAPYVRWFAKTDIADSASALHKIALKRTDQCEDPDPVMELEAISTIKLVDNSASGGLATSAATCVITGDLELTNQGAAASGSAATNTTISVGVLSIQPFTQSDGKVAPPDAIVPKREVKDQADGTMIAATSLAVKANGDAEGAVAESEVTVNLRGHISVRCKNCGASGRIDF